MLTAANVVTAAQLGAPPGLGPSVDLDQALGEQGFHRSPGFGEASELQQLPEPDSCLADLYFLHIAALAFAHGPLNHRGRQGERGSSRTGP